MANSALPSLIVLFVVVARKGVATSAPFGNNNCSLGKQLKATTMGIAVIHASPASNVEPITT